MAVFPGEHSTIPVPELENWNLDRTVEPLTMVRGGMHKTSAGVWDYNTGQPATEDRQISILAALEDSLGNLNIVLKSLLRGILNPPYIDKGANQLRAQVTGTVTSSTTVAISDVTAVGGYNGAPFNRITSINTWANNVRARIS